MKYCKTCNRYVSESDTQKCGDCTNQLYNMPVGFQEPTSSTNYDTPAATDYGNNDSDSGNTDFGGGDFGGGGDSSDY